MDCLDDFLTICINWFTAPIHTFLSSRYLYIWPRHSIAEDSFEHCALSTLEVQQIWRVSALEVPVFLPEAPVSVPEVSVSDYE